MPFVQVPLLEEPLHADVRDGRGGIAPSTRKDGDGRNVVIKGVNASSDTGCTQESCAVNQVKVSYVVRGNGPIIVLLIPGMCVPNSMYDDLSAALSASPEYTAVCIDNRGIGRSDAPAATLFHTPGYTISRLAQDAWAVFDAVVAGRKRASLTTRSRAGIVGHSMGGMIAQRMAVQRADCVAFLGLLSTHAGGFWNTLPSFTMIAGALRLAWNRFDREVNAKVNMSFHFTPRFLDEFVHEVRGKIAEECAASISPTAKWLLSSARHPHAHLFFGDARAALRSARWPAAAAIVKSIGKIRRRRRRDVFQARYTGCENSGDDGGEGRIGSGDGDGDINGAKCGSTSARGSVDLSTTSMLEGTCTTRSQTPTPGSSSNSILSSTNAQDPPHALLAHMAVVRSHRLGYGEGRQLANCSRLVKLVVTGRHDRVVTPGSSRALAALIGANTYVELDGAHFVVEEAAAAVTVNVLDGLNQAFPQDASVCSCENCAPKKREVGELDGQGNWFLTPQYWRLW